MPQRRSIAIVRSSVLVMMLWIVGSAAGLLGQTTSATVEGIIKDASGASIPGGRVTVMNTATGVRRNVTSASDGRYLVNNLIPGPYQITAVAQGFSTTVISNITLAVTQDLHQDIKLAVGSVSQSLLVSATPETTDTENTSVGTVIDNRKVVQLPLANRQFYSLALLSPAAAPAGQNSTLGFRGGFNISGTTEISNNFTIDGIYDNDFGVGAPSFRPSVEDIQEFKLLTGVYTAEFGRNFGGQVVIVSKSGTNQLHGSAYWFIRNQITDAKPFFTQPGGTVPVFRQNTFGATIGGPIRKDKLFAFYAYEGQRIAQQITALGTVPTGAMQNGNFSGLPQIYDPTTGKPIPSNNLASIPSWNSAAAAYGRSLAATYPAPTILQVNPSSNYSFSETRTETMNEDSIRVDDTINPANSIFGVYNWFNDPSFEPSNSLCSSYVLPGGGCYTNQTSQLAGFSYTHIFTPNLLNEIKIGFDRLRQPRIGQDSTSSYANFSPLPGAFSDPSVANNKGRPNTQVSGYSTLGNATNLPQDRADNHYELIDNVTWNHGAHTLTAGLDFLFFRNAEEFVQDGRGALVFNSASIGKPGTLGTTGNSMADLLLGLPYQTIRNPTAPRFHENFHTYYGFVADNWKATQDITINAGLRYELDAPFTDEGNELSNFQPYIGGTGIYLVSGNGASLCAPGYCLPTGEHISKYDYTNFAPRLGIAWQPLHKASTVIRAAFGTFYNPPLAGNEFLSNEDQYPFRVPQTLSTSSTAANTPAQLTLSNPYPTPIAVPAQRTLAPVGVIPNYRNSTIYEWSFGVEQALTKSMILDVTYVGSRGTHLPADMNPNQAAYITSTPISGPNSNQVSGIPGMTTAPPSAGCPANGGPPVPGNCTNNRPMPYGNISYDVTSGYSNYQSLQTSVRQAYSNGISFLFAYTYAKSMDRQPGLGSTSNSSSGTPQNSNNLDAERGLSDFNIKHRLVFSPVAALPFGRGRAYLTSGIPSAIFGGFQVSGIVTWQTGDRVYHLRRLQQHQRFLQ